MRWCQLAALPWGDRFQKSAEALALKAPREMARWLSSLWKRNELPELLIASAPEAGPSDFFEQRWEVWRDHPMIERWMLTDMETYLEGGILVKVDRASMAVGLEARSPFLDHVLVEQVLRWPNRADPARGGKAILKRILSKYVPKELFERPKRGFGLPVEQWLSRRLAPRS